MKTIYDTRALTEDQWIAERENLLKDGWEYHRPIGGIVYLRKHLEGERHPTSDGWMK